MLSSTDREYIASLRLRCDSGDVLAMEGFASFYYEDHPELLDPTTVKLVLEYYEKAAEAGNQKATLNLGALYCDPLLGEPNYAKATALFESAISGDDARIASIACARLGDCYRFGKGVKADYSKAFDYYLEGVLLANHPVCLYKLGDMYHAGEFVRQDSKKAYFIYCKAKAMFQRFCNDSYAEILVRLAELMMDGLGTDKDVAGALKYLKMAQRMPHQSSNPENIPQKIDLLLKKASKAE